MSFATSAAGPFSLRTAVWRSGCRWIVPSVLESDSSSLFSRVYPLIPSVLNGSMLGPISGRSGFLSLRIYSIPPGPRGVFIVPLGTRPFVAAGTEGAAVVTTPVVTQVFAFLLALFLLTMVSTWISSVAMSPFGVVFTL